MQNVNRLQDQIEIVIGLWLCISPWVLGYSGPLQVAGWSAILVGIGVLLFSFEDLALPSEIEEWVELVLGLALMASPWVWNYSDNMPATLNALISGFLVTTGFVPGGGLDILEPPQRPIQIPALRPREYYLVRSPVPKRQAALSGSRGDDGRARG